MSSHGCFPVYDLPRLVSDHAHLQPTARSIKGLFKLLQESVPGCIKERTIGDYNGRKLAIDASMAIYQFLVRARLARTAPQLQQPRP